MKRISLQSIADVCEVSRMTVSSVLRNPGNTRFSKALRDKISKAAYDLGYVRNHQAVTFRNGKTGYVGLIIPWNIPELMDTVETELVKRRIGLSVQFSPMPCREAELSALKIAVEQNVDGLIWEPNTIKSLDEVPFLQSYKNKIVLLGEGAFTTNVNKIAFDYEQGIELAFRHAKEQGYRKLIYINHEDSDACNAMFLEWLKRFSIKYDIAAEATSLLSIKIPEKSPTLYLCQNDWLGIKLLKYAHEHDWNIPNKQGIMIIGDILLGGEFRLGEMQRIPLSAVQRDFKNMALCAIARLMGESDSNSNKKIPMQLVIRQSTQRKEILK
jgi:DNA-binding LacI/PurR family transcriptional regulator